MKFKSDIEVQAGLKDSSGSNGTSGQILSSNGTTVSWVPAGSSVANDVQNQVKAGVAINKGQAVYVTSADGTNIIVGLASNTTEATSSKTLGLLNATVAINGFADVVQIGRLTGLNTLAATVGDPVWLGADGNLIYGLANKPYAPLHLVFIGVVTRVNASNGEIFVNVQNGFELNEIHDVDLKTNVPINGDILGYNGTLWVNKTIAGWLGYTPADDANVVKLTEDQTIDGIKSFLENIVVKGINVGTDDTYGTSVILGQGANAILGGVSIGRLVGENLTTGESNVGVGSLALHYITEGNNNTAVGTASLTAITTGNDNIGIGLKSGDTITEGNRNTIIGSNSTVTPLGITTGNANTIIGRVTGLATAMSNNIILADGDGNIKYQWDGSVNNVNGKFKVNGQAYTSYDSDAVVTGTKTLDFNNGNIAFYTLTGSTTITLSNAIAGAVYTIRLTQGGSGSYTVTWDPLVKWGGGTTPTLSTAVGAIDIVTLLYDGTNFYGNIVKNFA